MPIPAARDELVALFGAFDAPLLVVTLEESELIKNGANAFLALKISFANEIAGLAERSGADAGPVLAGHRRSTRGSAARSCTRASASAAAACPRSSRRSPSPGDERGLEMHVTSAAAEANLAHQRGSPSGSTRSSAACGADRPARPGVQGGHRRHPLVAGRGARPAGSRPRRGRARVDPAAGGRRPRAVPALIVQTRRSRR